MRPDAPQFKTPADAVRWLNGKTVAVPQGSCSDRIAQATFQRIGIKPGTYLNQPIDVITTSFQNHNLDGAVVWEPTASHLVDAGLARRVASGTLATQTDAGFLEMSEQLLQDRPDVAEALAEGRARRAALPGRTRRTRTRSCRWRSTRPTG